MRPLTGHDAEMHHDPQRYVSVGGSLTERRCYTDEHRVTLADMPTTRARHLLTETDDIAQAIDTAAPLYPGESRADVLRHLVRLGAQTVAAGHETRREIVRQRAGRHRGLYPEHYLDELRHEWPE